MKRNTLHDTDASSSTNAKRSRSSRRVLMVLAILLGLGLAVPSVFATGDDSDDIRVKRIERADLPTLDLQRPIPIVRDRRDQTLDLGVDFDLPDDVHEPRIDPEDVRPDVRPRPELDTDRIPLDRGDGSDLTVVPLDRSDDTPEPRDDNATHVEICHAPPGNPANQRTLTVGAPAVDAHLEHGDQVGACADVGREHAPHGKDTTRHDTDPAKGKAHRAKGRAHRAKGKAHRAKGKAHHAKGKAHRAKAPRARGKAHRASGAGSR